MIDQTLQNLIDRLTTLMLKYNFDKKQYSSNKIKIVQNKYQFRELKNIQVVLSNLADESQKEMKEYIEKTVTMSLHLVYGDEYSFEMELNYENREQFEIKFYINKNGIRIEPRKDVFGGGVVDVADFVLRIIKVVIEEPQVAYIMFIDEPFKNVSELYLPAVGDMVVELAKMLEIQIIVVTHIKNFVEIADNVIYLEQ